MSQTFDPLSLQRTLLTVADSLGISHKPVTSAIGDVSIRGERIMQLPNGGKFVTVDVVTAYQAGTAVARLHVNRMQKFVDMPGSKFPLAELAVYQTASAGRACDFTDIDSIMHALFECDAQLQDDFAKFERALDEMQNAREMEDDNG